MVGLGGTGPCTSFTKTTSSLSESDETSSAESISMASSTDCPLCITRGFVMVVGERGT